MKKKHWIIIIVFMIIILATIVTCHFVVKHKKEKEQQLLVQEYYSSKLELYRKENEKYADYEVDVAFLGDSLTDGYDLEKYYPEYVVSNRGIGGETTYGLKKRMQVSVYDLKPKVVVMLIGGNNLDTMFNDYEDILKELENNLPSTKIVLLSLTAMGKDWAYKNEIACFNNIKIKLLASKYDCEFVDLYTHLFDLNTNEINSNYTNDGVHFTSDGYKVVTDQIKPVLAQMLNNN